MNPDYPVRVRKVARRTALSYLALAALWILLSDRAVRLVTADPAMIERISMIKGWLFVAVTATLLYLALRKQLGRVEREAGAHHRAARALAEAEERQRLFIEHAPAALAMFDREMRYLAASRRWSTAFSLVGEELVGRWHYEVFPHLPERLKETHRRGLAGEVVSAKADPYERADGTTQWLQWEVRPWRTAEGEVGGIVIFAEDITERIAADGALRESEERYRLLAEYVGDVVWVMNVATMRFEYVSPSILRLRGFTAAEVMAEPITSGMAPESLSLVESEFPVRVAAFQAGDPAAVTQSHEIRQLRRDGSWVWVEVVTTLVHNPRGGLQVVGVSRSIDERKRAEAELRGSEDRFRRVVEAAPVAIFLQADGRFAYLNGAAVALFAAGTPETLLGQPVLERFHPADRPRVQERIQMLNHGRVRVPLAEEHILRCDGTVAEAEVAAVPFQVEQRDGALVFARDITEQKRARDRLRMQETVLQETGVIAKVGGWSLDPATGEGFWTDEVARIHGLDPVDKTSLARGLSFYEGEGRHRIEAALRAAIERAEPYDLQLELVTADGRRKWVRTIGHPVVENGRVIRVHGSFQDLTELHEATAALRESEARFRELAETITEVFWINDPGTGRQLYVSPAYERIFGGSCATLYARPGAWMNSIQDEDRPRVAAAFARLPATGEYNESYRIVRPDGEIRWIHDRGYPVRDAAGKVVRLVGVAEDVTETKRIEAQFLRAQRLEAVGALAGGVAHDLNNILTPVLMAAGVLKGEADQTHNLELLSMIEQSARRGADIIQQLLTFSRGVEGERILLQPRHLIREMAAIVRETFPREIGLEMNVAADLWLVEGNSTQLHQVLMNLCVNARDAMPKGGKLTLEARNLQVTEDDCHLVPELKAGPHVAIDVADTGEGIPADMLAKIFEPFFTTKGLGKGTGLGLSTVLGIVRSHGGHVSVYSEPARGAHFKVYLPARPEGGAAEAAAVPPAPAAGRGELVLVVDDEPTIRGALCRVLDKNGYRSLVAGNGQEALSVVLQHVGMLRLVVTDVMMPVMDGIALARALRTLDPAIRIIATSGMGQEEKREELRASGVQAILAKPCETAVMLTTIRRVLDTVG